MISFVHRKNFRLGGVGLLAEAACSSNPTRHACDATGAQPRLSHARGGNPQGEVAGQRGRRARAAHLFGDATICRKQPATNSPARQRTDCGGTRIRPCPYYPLTMQPVRGQAKRQSAAAVRSEPASPCQNPRNRATAVRRREPARDKGEPR